MRDTENQTEHAADDLPPQVAEMLVAYEKAKGAGDDSAIDEGTLEPELRTRLEENISCVDLLHRIWPEEEPVLADVGATNHGSILGDYRILREIGRGGMGVVYEAEQISLPRRVALKVLPFAGMLDPRQLERFKNESRAAATLDHPGIVSVYAVGCERAVHFYALQYIEGQSLAEVIAELRGDTDEGGPAPELSQLTEQFVHGDSPGHQAAMQTVEQAADSTRRVAPGSSASSTPLGGIGTTQSRAFFQSAARLGVDVAEALDHAHARGIVHRDIKPGNLLLDTEGKVSVADFGLARIEADAGVTMTGDIIGTLRYMSPEQALAKRVVVDHRTDIYSLGVTLYELLTLQPPFRGNDRSVLLRQIAFDEPVAPRRLNKAIPSELETIVQKAIAKNPNDRYATAQELADDLRRFLDDKPIKARRVSRLEHAWRWARRNPVVSSLAATTVVLAVLVAVVASIGYAQATAALAQSEVERINANTARRDALSQRDTARLSEYHAEIISGQADWRTANVGRLERNLMDHLPIGQQPDYRGWEWYYLLSLCHPEERTIFDPGWVPFAAWSPDGEYIGVSGSIWNAQSGEALHRFSPSKIIRYRGAWSPDGNKYAWGMAADDSSIYVWDRRGDTVSRLGRHESSVWALAWSPDGGQLASGSMDDTVKIWDVAQRATVQTLRTYAAVDDVAWSPDGELLAAALRDSGLRIWSMFDGEFSAEREGPNYRDGKRISWRPDGRQLAVCTDKKWYLLDRADWSVSHEQDHPTSTGSDIAWNPAGTQLAVAHGEVVTVWDPAGTQPVATMRGHSRPVGSVAWSPDSRRLVSSDTQEEIKIWNLDVPTEPPLIHAGGPLESIRWLPTGHTLVAVSAADGAAAHWDAAKGTRIKVEPAVADGLRSPDGRLVAVQSQGEEEPEIEVHDAQGIRAVWHADPRHALGEIAWSADGSKLAIATKLDRDPAVEFWDVDGERRISRWSRPAGKGSPHRMTWSPDGTRVAVVALGDEGENGWEMWIPHLHLIDISTGTRTRKILSAGARGDGGIGAVAWSGDGHVLAWGDTTGMVEIVDLREPSATIVAKPHVERITSLAFSPDGQRLAVAAQDGAVKVLTVDQGEDLLTLPLENGVANWLAWSPDGQRLAAASEAGEIKVWDASRGYQLTPGGSRRNELAWAYFRRGEPEDLHEFLDLAPDTLAFWRERGHAQARVGRFEEAALEFAKATRPGSQFTFQDAIFCAHAQLGAGETESYRQTCDALIEEFADSDVPSNGVLVAWLCVLAPSALSDSAEVLRMAQRCCNAEGHDPGDLVRLILGASLYRDGRFQEAVDHLEPLAAKLDKGADQLGRYESACSKYYLAMARHQLGHEFQARRLLGEASRQAELVKENKSGRIESLWIRPLVLNTLSREATALLGIGGTGSKTVTEPDE